MKSGRVDIPEDARARAVGRIKAYFRNERDEDLGDLAAGFVLDFFLEEVAPAVYNQGLEDAQAWFARRLEDLEADYRSLRVDNRRRE